MIVVCTKPNRIVCLTNDPELIPGKRYEVYHENTGCFGWGMVERFKLTRQGIRSARWLRFLKWLGFKND